VILIGPHSVHRASIIFPGETIIPTCPGLVMDVPGPALKNTRSPACSSPASTFSPNGHCPNVVRGIDNPAFR
jgi:hypothetical protein